MGSYKVWLDENSLIRGRIEGIHTRQDAEKMIDEVFALADENENLKKLMVDLKNVERTTMGGRRAHAENMKTERMGNWKVAYFGANTVNMVMANFIIRVSGRNDKFKQFESENEAVNWLLR